MAEYEVKQEFGELHIGDIVEGDDYEEESLKELVANGTLVEVNPDAANDATPTEDPAPAPADANPSEGDAANSERHPLA